MPVKNENRLTAINRISNQQKGEPRPSESTLLSLILVFGLTLALGTLAASPATTQNDKRAGAIKSQKSEGSVPTTMLIDKATGTARNEKKQVVYVEKHEFHYGAGGKLTRLETKYLEPDTLKPIAELATDYTVHPFVPQFAFRDQRLGRKDGIDWLDKKNLKAYGQRGYKEELKSKEFAIHDDLIAGQGLHNFIVENLKFFSESDEVKKIDFLIPMRQEIFKFKARRISAAKDQIKVKVEISSWVLRLFAPDITVIYDIRQKRLMSYEGASNILAADGSDQNVIITYEYELASNPGVI